MSVRLIRSDRFGKENDKGSRRSYIGVVILCQNIEKASIDVWFHIIEFSHIGVLEPVDQHFGTEHE